MTEIHSLPGCARLALKVRTGTQESAILYTKKGDQTHEEWTLEHEHGPNFGINTDWVEYGTKFASAAGSRTDIHGLLADVRNAKTDWDLAENHGETYLKYYKAVQQLRTQIRPVKDQPTQLYLIVGPTGVGKTRKAYQDWPDLWEIPISQGLSNWYDGYAGQKYVLYDDFAGSMPLQNALKLFDSWYIRQVPTKGGHVWFNPEIIIITSNYHPSTWYDYKDRQEWEYALRRRFHKVFHGPDLIELNTEDQIKSWWPLPKDKVNIQQNIDNNYLSDQEVNRLLIQ